MSKINVRTVRIEICGAQETGKVLNEARWGKRPGQNIARHKALSGKQPKSTVLSFHLCQSPEFKGAFDHH